MFSKLVQIPHLTFRFNLIACLLGNDTFFLNDFFYKVGKYLCTGSRAISLLTTLVTVTGCCYPVDIRGTMSINSILASVSCNIYIYCYFFSNYRILTLSLPRPGILGLVNFYRRLPKPEYTRVHL